MEYASYFLLFKFLFTEIPLKRVNFPMDVFTLEIRKGNYRRNATK